MSHITLAAFKFCLHIDLSGHVPEIQAEVEVVKIKNPDFLLLDIIFLIQKNYQKFFFEEIEKMIFLFHR